MVSAKNPVILGTPKRLVSRLIERLKTSVERVKAHSLAAGEMVIHVLVVTHRKRTEAFIWNTAGFSFKEELYSASAWQLFK